MIEKGGHWFRLRTPHKAFNRHIGSLAGAHVTPDSQVVDAAQWNERWSGNGFPRRQTARFVASLMGAWLNRASSPTGLRHRPSASTASRWISNTCAS